jgi:molybdopterin synthase catalytic subunit
VQRFEFSFCDGPLDARSLEVRARRDEDGAVVTFVGVTRNHHDGRSVVGLAYEAYEAMAVARVLAILAEVGGGHDVGRILVEHRLGEVPIGEASIAVVVSAPHRGPAFDAVREVMDRIKREAPIFKKEFFGGGEDAEWVGEVPRV